MIAPLQWQTGSRVDAQRVKEEKVIPKIVHQGVTITGTLRGETVLVVSFVGRKSDDGSTIEGFGLKIVWKNSTKTRFFFEVGSHRIHRPADFYRARKVLERLIPALLQARERKRPIEQRALRVCLDLVTRPQAELPHASLRKIARHLGVNDRAELLNTLNALNMESDILERILKDTRLLVLPIETPPVNGTGPLRITGTHYLDPRIGLPNSS